MKIYINYFNESQLIKSRIFTPIQVGRALSEKKLDMLGDDENIGISEKNASYCELTGQYWAWKNDQDSEYLGFMHYRRFLDFYPSRQREVTIHGVMEDRFYDGFCEHYGLVDEHVEDFVRGYDAIVPEVFNVEKISCRSVRHHYETADFHRIKDFDLAEKIVSDLQPDYARFFKKMASGQIMYTANMFVLKRELFEEYSEWLFPLLEELERKIDTRNYNSQEKRVIGYLSERLFTVFILKKIEDGIKIKHLRRIFVKDTSAAPCAPALPDTKLPIISIVAATDKAYLPHMGALISSIFMNADRGRYLDIIILDGGLSNDDKRLLQTLTRLHPACQINFIDMSKQYIDVPVHSYFSRSTFYRLSLPKIITNRDKILFLDTDMVVVSDVCPLFDTELNGKTVAVVRDLIMKTFTAMGIRSNSETRSLPSRVYLTDKLNLKDNYKEYFQAGTILFNLKKMRETAIAERMIRDIRTERYWFLDQDVLNKNLIGDTLFVGNEWNTVYIDKKHLEYLSSDEVVAYRKSQDAPKIIHYAGIGKPWENTENPLGHYYWFYLRQTPWYEEMLFNYINANRKKGLSSGGSAIAATSFRRRFARKIWHFMPQWLQTAILPLARKADRLVR